MIRIQIVEQEGASLYRTLVKAMRRGDLRTFTVKNRGRKVAHINYPGWLRWGTLHGVIAGEVGSKRPGEEAVASCAARATLRSLLRVDPEHFDPVRA